MKPMATSSDVILTSRHSHSVNDLTTTGSGSGPRQKGVVGGRAPPSKSDTAKKPDSDSTANAAACYGIDTVHSWATVSAGSGAALRNQQLSGWRSDVDVYSKTLTPSMDITPVPDQSNGLQQSSSADVQEKENSPETPKAPPRTKHRQKARAPLPPTFTTTDIGLLCVHHLYTYRVAPKPPCSNDHCLNDETVS